MLFDLANKEAMIFYETFKQELKKAPGWRSIYSYDAAKLIVTAIDETNITGSKLTIDEDRKKIKNFLAKLDYDHHVQGVTGPNYFDSEGACSRDILMGIYNSKNFVSAPIQLFEVKNMVEVTNPLEEIQKGNIIVADDQYFYRSNLIYTGVNFKEIKIIDLEESSCSIDFQLWYRYHNQLDVEPQDIEFVNALEPVELGEPIYEMMKDNNVYQLYRSQGKFRVDFLPTRYSSIGQNHQLGLSFHHRNLTMENLIYGNDIFGLSLGDTISVAQKLESHYVLNDKSGWVIDAAWFYQTSYNESSLGQPKYINKLSGVDYSLYNAEVEIVQGRWWTRSAHIDLNEIIPYDLIQYILVVASILILVFFFLTQDNILKHFRRSSLIVVAIVGFLLFITTRYIITAWLLKEGFNKQILDVIAIIFQILWWIVPAIIINAAIKRYIWERLEKKAGRIVPKVMRNFVTFIIFTMVILGIIAFVFNQKVTGLLAASGVLAMIIGLAVQMNLSNIFSGIAINIERPFNVGDWVRIGSDIEGKVEDINWRTTRIKTGFENIISLPNSEVANSKIENYDFPDDKTWFGFVVHVDAAHPPDKVAEILKKAISTDEKVLEPWVMFAGISEWSANYWVYARMADYRANRHYMRRTMWTEVWKHLNEAGITPITHKKYFRITEDNKEIAQIAKKKPEILKDN